MKTNIGNIGNIGNIKIGGKIGGCIALVVFVVFIVVLFLVTYDVPYSSRHDTHPFIEYITYLRQRLLKKDVHSVREGFTWNKDTERRFALFQGTMNPRFFFDLSSVEQQASQEEVESLLETGVWPWESVTQQLFIDNVQTNPIIKTNPLSTMQYARGIYNNQAAKQLLSWTTPEGQMLLSGALVDNPENHADDAGQGTYGVSSGLVSPNKDIIRCEKVDGLNGGGAYQLKRIHNLGNDGITQVHVKVKTDVSYTDLPSLIPGFTFSPRVGPCDPCVALKNTPDYSCPFSLKNGPDGISDMWKHLWGLSSS